MILTTDYFNAFVYCLRTEHQDELAECLAAKYPVTVTAALLAIVEDPNDTQLLRDAYRVWRIWDRYDHNGNDFVQAVEEITGESETFVCECGYVTTYDETSAVGNDMRVCDDRCLDSYTECDVCNEYHRDTTSVASDEDICERCLERHYWYCDVCNAYYHDDDDHRYYCDECQEYYHEDDDHSHGCDCEPPHRNFKFQANGHGLVAQNERLTVELPKGTIGEEGIKLIKELLREGVAWHVIDETVESVGPLWQAKQGNFTRRLSSAFYKQHGIKLAPGVISEIGNLARAHSSDEAVWHIEFTRDVNGSAEDFCNDGSCWWGSHHASRCCLKSWGGLGLRTYHDPHVPSYSPSGRVWVQPLNEELRPTHDALDAHAHVIFNGYGDLSGYIAARIVAHLTSRSYCKINLDTDHQYVNGQAGYLVADEATCGRVESLYFPYDAHNQQDAHTYDMKEAAA